MAMVNGYLKVYKTGKTKKGKPKVALLILKEPSGKEGTWFQLFDMWYFGGNNSPYDVRTYADPSDPCCVEVVCHKEQAGYWVIDHIQPEGEVWEKPSNGKKEEDPFNAQADPGQSDLAEATLNFVAALKAEIKAELIEWMKEN